jgi:hypothetical protein
VFVITPMLVGAAGILWLRHDIVLLFKLTEVDEVDAKKGA